MPVLLSQPHGNHLGDLLNRRLQDPQWTTFRSAVAFVKRSGVMHIADSLRTFARRGRVRMTVGVSMGGTSVEGLQSLLECLDGRGEVWVFHNENGPTFHPKMYVFSSDRIAEVIIGSGNLTQGGLFDNYEASIALTLNLTDPDDRALLTGVEAVLDEYTDHIPGTAVALSHETLERLRTAGYVVPEAQMRHPARRPTTSTHEFGVPPAGGPLFRHVAGSSAASHSGRRPRDSPATLWRDSSHVLHDASTDRRRYRSDDSRHSTAIAGDLRPPRGA